MLDIVPVFRIGPDFGPEIRNTLFSISQYMLEREVCVIAFEAQETEGPQFSVTIKTEFKTGSNGEAVGTLFNAHVELEDKTTIQTSFISDYEKEWREHSTIDLEVFSFAPFGGDPEKFWMN